MFHVGIDVCAGTCMRARMRQRLFAHTLKCVCTNRYMCMRITEGTHMYSRAHARVYAHIRVASIVFPVVRHAHMCAKSYSALEMWCVCKKALLHTNARSSLHASVVVQIAP